MKRRSTNAGFTLVELMITIAIMAIVITVGIPSLSGYVAAQRVRTAASDLMADIAFTRAEAIKESRQAKMQLLPGSTTWKDGWRICVDLDRDNPSTRVWDCDSTNAAVRKISPPLAGNIKVCGVGTLPDMITFRPDGRVTPLGASDGIKVSDVDGTTDRIRAIYIGVSGRPRMEIQDGGAPC